MDYVAVKRCGCVVAWCSEKQPKDRIAKLVAGWIRCGYSVERMTTEKSREVIRPCKHGVGVSQRDLQVPQDCGPRDQARVLRVRGAGLMDGRAGLKAFTKSPLLRWKLLSKKRADETVESFRTVANDFAEDCEGEDWIEDQLLAADLLEFLREAKHVRG